ncbi:MAG: N-acetylmuramate alpha-1-phosphate uridylyltransferase MurU [Burkholderiaceae bacterium]|jgi:MurNAc alpha-1-phosphate uridylyltransferase
MRAMILAAGRGERLRPLTDTRPKALIEVGGRALIEWQVARLAQSGWRDLVINHAWLGDQIEAHLGSGERLGARIRYSREASALETLGGIVHARPYLGSDAFLVVSSDIYTDFDYATLVPKAAVLDRPGASFDAHFILVDNPAWHPQGDMGLTPEGTASRAAPKLTYANIALYHPRLFVDLPDGRKEKLFPWAFAWVDQGRVSGSRFTGLWHNIGTAADLAAAQSAAQLRAGSPGAA